MPRGLLQAWLGSRISEAAAGFLRVQQANVGQFLVARGLLALEEGDNPAAADAFRRALEYAGPDTYFESRAVAVRYLDLLDTHLRD